MSASLRSKRTVPASTDHSDGVAALAPRGGRPRSTAIDTDQCGVVAKWCGDLLGVPPISPTGYSNLQLGFVVCPLGLAGKANRSLVALV